VNRPQSARHCFGCDKSSLDLLAFPREIVPWGRDTPGRPRRPFSPPHKSPQTATRSNYAANSGKAIQPPAVQPNPCQPPAKGG
jgi:hypothetical protein